MKRKLIITRLLVGGAVFSITANNEIVRLDEGNYIIPAFDDYEKAKEYAGEAFQVIEFKTLQQK